LTDPKPSEGGHSGYHVCVHCGKLYDSAGKEPAAGYCTSCKEATGGKPNPQGPKEDASPEELQETSAVRRLRKEVLEVIKSGSGPPPADPFARSGHTLLGRYKVLHELGTTMLSQVYLAFDNILSRKVVIKYLNLKDRPEHVERFKREASLLANLKHPNIVSVYDSGIEDGRPYIVMEYVEGIDLERFNTALVQGKDEDSRIRRILEIIYELCFALDYLHAQGIVHRDIKPQNVMLDRLGKPFLIDFGIARQDSGDDKITVTGAILGTLVYMSPEQADRDDAIDHRSDIYSLGMMLYQLLTGSLPFTGASYDELIRKLQQEMPPLPSGANPSIPEGIDAVILKTLAKGRDERYQTAKELAHDLEPFIMGEGAEVVGPTEQGVYSRYRVHIAVGLNAVAVALVLLNLIPQLPLWGSGGGTQPGGTRFTLSEGFDKPGSIDRVFRKVHGRLRLEEGRIRLEDGLVLLGSPSQGRDFVDLGFDVMSDPPERMEEIRIGLFVNADDPTFRGLFVQLKPEQCEGAVRVGGTTVARFRTPRFDPAGCRITIGRYGRTLTVRSDEELVVQLEALELPADTSGVFSIQTLGVARIDDIAITVRKTR
jgi:tRNA A-37 threonylcarbamoyl transferase component Bud32